MQRFLEVMLGLSLLLVGYTYIGYAVAIWGLSRLFGKTRVLPVVADANLPTVAVLIAAHNEERWIQPRIENVLAQNYPPDRLIMRVASDGSQDQTAEILRELDDPRVRPLLFEKNRGKSAVLNDLVSQSCEELLVFSDANTFFDGEAIRNLARWFSDPRVGAVCGRLILNDPVTGRNVDSVYWKYETFLKKCEGRLGAVLGANGAIYALRREEYVPIPTDTIIDDFMIPLLARSRNGKSIEYDEQAIAREEAPPHFHDEFLRRSRIGAGGFQSLARLMSLFSPTQGWICLSFISHKFLRWLSPFCLVVAFVSNLLLLPDESYRLLMAIQIAFYSLSLYGILFASPGQHIVSKMVRIPAMFTTMNVALLFGFWKWLSGRQKGIWQRTAR